MAAALDELAATLGWNQSTPSALDELVTNLGWNQ